MRRLLITFLAAGLLAGCGEPKLDGSSNEAFKASAEKISAGLSKEQREKFQSDLIFLAFQKFDMAKAFSGKASPDEMANDAIKALDGKTVSQVFQEADRVRAARAENERRQAINEIAELTGKMQANEAAKAKLSKFEVLKARFYKKKSEFISWSTPIIEISVRNDTDQAVSWAYFKGTLASPGRSVPWLVKEFNYQISGGIEPGETKTWSLSPNEFDGWGQVKPSEDAVLTVEVVKLDGADGKALFGSGGFGAKEKERLAMLKAKYQN